MLTEEQRILKQSLDTYIDHYAKHMTLLAQTNGKADKEMHNNDLDQSFQEFVEQLDGYIGVAIEQAIQDHLHMHHSPHRA